MIAGKSGELQLRKACPCGAWWGIVPAPWQPPAAAVDASARPQFWPAQRGAQAGATTRATRVTSPRARSGQLVDRIRIALGNLLLRYAGHTLAST